MATAEWQQRVENVLKRLYEQFESGKVADYVKEAVLARMAGDGSRPCEAWSWGNQFLVLLHGTKDARGFRQWESLGRFPKAGSKAFHILAPRFMPIKEQDGEKTDANETERRALIGFKTVPVFRVEDTTGEPLPPAADYTPPTMPPLADVAEKFGLNVSYGPGHEGGAFGWYCDTTSEVKLMTHDEGTFWHELGHASHYRVLRGKGIDPAKRTRSQKEIVAEVTSCTIAQLYGRDKTGYAWPYVSGWAGGTTQALRQFMSLFTEIGEALTLILKTAELEAAPVGAWSQLETDTWADMCARAEGVSVTPAPAPLPAAQPTDTKATTRKSARKPRAKAPVPVTPEPFVVEVEVAA